MTSWQLGILANGVIGVAYAGIAWIVLRGVHRNRGGRTDRLAVATGGIFASCSAGHLAHFDHLVLGAEVVAARAAYDLHLVVVDGITAVVAVLYWSLRRTTRSDGSAAEVFTGAGRRLEEAEQIHDLVLRQLVAAKLALDLDRPDDARAAVHRGLAATTDLVAHLDPEGDIGGQEAPSVPVP